jgi:hypothetical protein
MKYFFKTCLTSIAAIGLISVAATAQSFTITDEKPQSFDFAQGAYKFTMKIRNATLVDRTLKVTEITEEVMPLDQSYFCVGELCLPADINEYEAFIAGNESSDLYVYLKDTANVNGTRKVRYIFANAEDPSDKLEHTFTFLIGPTSVNENTKGIIAVLSSPAPNPANSSALIHYSMPESSYGAIELFSADGKLLKTFSLGSANSSLIIPTTDLAAGSYFYSLMIDGKAVATNSLVISR